MNFKKIYKKVILGIFFLFLLALLPFQARAANVELEGLESTPLSEVLEALGEKPISGIVRASDGTPLIGATVQVKGTGIGTVTDMDGNYQLNVPDDATTLVISFMGYVTQEVEITGRSVIDVQLMEDFAQLDEVVVIGYGTKKKVNLTGAVSTVDSEAIEDRPISNVQQALQGAVPNLVITTTKAGGEPGANMDMNIRGLQSIEGNSQPYVLVDGIPMGINDINPDDVETISVLKDAAASAIYGARAAYGVILITTKKGKTDGVTFSYSGNVANSSPLNWPDFASTMDFALTLNESQINAGFAPGFSAERLNNLALNLVNPGSAPEMYANADNTNWDQGSWGEKSSGNYDWKEIMFDESNLRHKHNLGVSGGNEKVNFYVSAGFFNEDGILRHGEESFKRYNLDAKVNGEATSWMDLSLFVKYKYSNEDFPWSPLARGRILDALTKIKPMMVPKYPGTDIWNNRSRISEWQAFRDEYVKKQLVISPRIILEPIKNWVTNIELNYITNNNRQVFSRNSYQWIRPNGELVNAPATAATEYNPNMYSNEYLSPNIYTNYSKSFGNHNLGLMAGYQHETYNYYNMRSTATYVLSDKAPSLSTAVGEKTVWDQIGHWATQGYFGRLNYNYDEKYLLEMNVRRDGSSRFEEGSRWSTFPSFSAGWVLSKENFFPLKDQIDFLKFRGSYGVLGNQNVANYLYIPTLPIDQSYWLFGGERAWTVDSPDLSSVNLTWEKVETIDFGFNLMTLNNRLAITFDWYQSKTTDLVGPGVALPAVLGTSAPKANQGEITTNGWEVEIEWKNRVNKDFSYGFRGVLSDYQSKVTKFINPTKILSSYYEGEVMNDIWGYETAGLYQDQNDLESYGIDQTYIHSGEWKTGDVKYVDQNGDDAINIGDNTVDNPGDKKIIGNSTPRFQYGLMGNVGWKQFDLSFYWQGVAKRDVDIRGGGTFRGPSVGIFHSTVYKEHMDYFRDETSLLGANPDAYFPRPYAEYYGSNQKNYGSPTDRYLQNGAYLRLKNVQIGFTLPEAWAKKARLSYARMYVSGENLLTFTNLMFFDPETIEGSYTGGSGGIGKSYPLSRTFSLGLNINF